MSKKKAGVGTARKIGMDFILKYAKQDSLIFCLDADTMVKNNYLDKVIKHYKKSKFDICL